MRTRIFILAAAVSLVLPATAGAQEAPGPMRDGPGRVRQTTIEWLLTQKAQFRPTVEQVAKLEAIQKKLSEHTAVQRSELQKRREEARSSAGSRREAYEKLRPIMEEMHKADEQATAEALGILNGGQREVVENLLEQRRKQMEDLRSRMRRPMQDR